VTTTASRPARFSSVAQKPPTSASPKAPVSGDFAPTACLPLPGTDVPDATPVAKTSGFSGDRGSTPFGARLSSSRAMNPHPPKYIRY